MHIAIPYNPTLREVNRLLEGQNICFEVSTNEFGTCFVYQVFVNSHKACKHVGDSISSLYFLEGVKTGLCCQISK
ncbi:hypothetical protein P4I85_14140 [Bacillus cereus]|nr:hypothetical protein [Bacillus cereus]MRC02951.1 hypothetical protein [Bacillus thuringiensis]